MSQFRNDRLKRSFGVKGIVTEKFERSAVQLVAATLAHDVDLIGTESVFGRVGFTLHLEFLDSVLRQNDRRGIQGSVGVHQSVQGVIVRGGTATIDADSVSFTLPHLPLFAGGLHGASTNE